MSNIKLPPLPEQFHNAMHAFAVGVAYGLHKDREDTGKALIRAAEAYATQACAERDARIAELEAQLAGGQEPVAWTILCDGHYVGNNFTYEKLAVEKMRALNISYPNEARCVVPLYTRPTQPLSDEQIEIGRAIERACRDLPEWAVLQIDLEKDAGTVSYCASRAEEYTLPDGDGPFSDQINRAIDEAIAAHGITGEKP